MRILLPVIDSVNALPAARYVAREFFGMPRPEVRLLYLPSPASRSTILRPVCRLLDTHGIPYDVRPPAAARDKACAILAAAGRETFDCIVLGTARPKSATRLTEESVVQAILDEAPIPVILVSGREVSRLERYTVTAGLAATLGLLAAG